MPIAVAFAKKINVIDFDLNAAKIELYKNGINPTREAGNDAIKNTAVNFTVDEVKLCEEKFCLLRNDKSPRRECPAHLRA